MYTLKRQVTIKEKCIHCGSRVKTGIKLEDVTSECFGTKELAIQQARILGRKYLKDQEGSTVKIVITKIEDIEATEKMLNSGNYKVKTHDLKTTNKILGIKSK